MLRLIRERRLSAVRLVHGDPTPHMGHPVNDEDEPRRIRRVKGKDIWDLQRRAIRVVERLDFPDDRIVAYRQEDSLRDDVLTIYVLRERKPEGAVCEIVRANGRVEWATRIKHIGIHGEYTYYAVTLSDGTVIECRDRGWASDTPEEVSE